MKNYTYQFNSIFQLESGKQLPNLEINYSISGQFEEHKKVVWICHALTANSNPSSWWSDLVGEGKFYNPEEYFIVCANIIGSCYGTSGPTTLNESGKPYYYSFPDVTIRDMVKAHEVLRQYLGIHKIHTCIGGSVGGQQALEWAILAPTLIKNLVVLCTNAFHSPWGIAFNEAQRMALKADSTFGQDTLEAGAEGLKAARAMALLSYRNYHTYNSTQAEKDIDKLDNYAAASYQQYQGQKLQNRFNAYSYWILSKAMDSHQVGRGRGSVENALALIQSKTLVIGINSDILFPVEEQIFLAKLIPNARLELIDSAYGHDGFLLEFDKIRNCIFGFYQN